MSKRGFEIEKKVGKGSFRIHILLLLFILLSSGVLGTLNVALSDQGTGVTDKITGELLGSGNLTVEVYDSLLGGNLVYSETFSDAIINGSWNVMLGENASNPLALEFGRVYYRDYSINGEDVSFTNLSGDVVGRQFFFSPLGDVASEDLADSAVTSSKLEQSINLSNGTGYLWDNLFGIPLTFPSSTDKAADGFYLYNDTFTLYLNESQLNTSIEAISSHYNETSYIENLITLNNESWTSTSNATYDTWSYNQTAPANAYTDELNDSVTSRLGNKLDTSDQRYNETDWILSQGYLTSEAEPLFILENMSLWSEALNKFNQTYDTYAYNQTQPAIDYVNAQGFLTSISWLNVVFMNESFLNDTYLLKGENLSGESFIPTNVVFMNETYLNDTYLLKGENETGGSVSWDNVVFMNETFLNGTYLLFDENASIWTALFDRLTSTELNASYLLKGENETSIFLPANVVFMNETLLNDSYLLKGENETGSVDWSNVAFLNDSVFNSSYLSVGQNETYNATYDTWAYNQTQPAIDYVNAQGFIVNGSSVELGPSNLTGDVYLPVQSLAGCSGKLITDSNGNITCGIDATGGSADYTNIAMTNQSNTFSQPQVIENTLNLTGDVFLSITGLASCNGKLITDASGNITCGTDQTSLGGMDYTNVAMTNESNTFTPNQTFADNIFITNNLGIGTTGPAASLHSYTTADVAQMIEVQNANSTGTTANAAFYALADTASLSMQAHGTGRTISRWGLTLGGWAEVRSGVSNGLVVGTEAATPLILGTSTLERMRIDSSGNVGIGTTNPSQKLNVEGSMNVTNDLFLPVQSLGNCYGKLITDASGNVTCGVDADTDTDTRCDVSGTCSQVCIGTDCRSAWPTGNGSDGDITDVVAGSGLTGGATSGSATLNVGAGTGISVAADSVSIANPTKSCNSTQAIQAFDLDSSANPTCINVPSTPSLSCTVRSKDVTQDGSGDGCQAGEVLTGGGCNNGCTSARLARSFELSGTWYCDYEGSCDWNTWPTTVQEICCKIT